MIFISDKNNEKTLTIPINLGRNENNFYDLILLNTTTRQDYLYHLKDTRKYRNYYEFTVLFNLPDLPDGEYEYKLKDNDNVYSTGLVRVGDYNPERIEYENEIKYKYQRDI